MTVDELANRIAAWLNARKVGYSMAREARSLTLTLPRTPTDEQHDGLCRLLLASEGVETHWTEDDGRRWHVALKGD